ncbi:glucosamine-6-phosphate deaminase [Phycicoccus endophyticus]|uniref:Glucosamine-6-phosphate deaminase n=1 Tax=Phycicoccus endophyticus TaxID=1690220 RepID=A0A7G9QZE7_9MICO|nr:glucosamine-6-phosphate deaminase [Phycicoccus endophyticus]NHI19080.1 glucosamine-6-phosphate deaminase [Phycicoccus endophyticus]QNN48722.1 glucosamine-6-phosphate deaminase [Phycicoccus endophyticus]GGL32633.1 glucosamine-6-phosphate deaminase [Phycicoccus endophyticus]
MEILVSPDPDRTAERAAEAVLSGLARTHSGDPVLGLATGSSPLGLYRALGRAVDAGRADFGTTHGVALDEYVGLPPGHPEGYRQVLLREVCGVIGLAPERLEVPDGSAAGSAALEAAAAAYEARIAELGGVDVQVLGIGANGHLGFNEPGSALTSRTRVKRLSARTRRDNARFFTGLDDVPTHCLTQGLGTILEARRLVLVATGDGKADAVAAAIEGPLTASVPASVLQWHADTVVCLDEAAAAGLRNRQYYDDSAAGLPEG